MATTVKSASPNDYIDALSGLDWSMHLIDPERKNAEWAYQVVTYLYGNMSYYYTYRGYNNWDGVGGMSLIRNYSDGKQSPDIYKQQFDPQFKQERTGGNPSVIAPFVGLNWKIISVIPKYRRILEARLNKIETNIECTATDVEAKNQKQDARQLLSVQKYVDELLKPIGEALKQPIKSNFDKSLGKSPVTGQAMSALNDVEFDLSNDAELQFYMDNYFKLKEEVANELTLQTILDLNEIERIKKRLDRDAIDYGFVGARVFRDNNTMFPKIEQLDISRIMMPFSARNDKKDIGGWGYYEYCSLNRVIELLGNELDVNDIRELYNWATTYPTGIPTNYQYNGNSDNSRLTFFDFERVKLPLVYVEFLSQNCETYEYQTTRFGTQKLSKVAYDHVTKDKNRTVKQHWAQVAYTGYYIPDFPKFLGFKKLENQIRNEGNPQLCKFTGVFWEFEPKSLVEQMIPHADAIQLAELKLQHALIKALPQGWSFNWDALSDVVLGDPSITGEKLLQTLLQTGSTIHRTRDENGNPIMANANTPHQYLPNGLPIVTIEGYWQVIAHHIDMIEKIIGYSPPMAGDPSDPRISAAAQKLAAAASDNATYFLTEGMKYALSDIAVITNTHIQNIIQEKGKAYEALKDMVGSLNLGAIESLDRLPLHHFGITMKEKMTDEKKLQFMSVIAQAYAKGEIDLSDMLAIEFFDNYKMAVSMMNLRIKKKQQAAIQAQQAQIQADQQQTQSIEQIKMMVEKMWSDTELQKTQMQVQGGLQEESMKQHGNTGRTQQQHYNKLGQEQQRADLDARNKLLEKEQD